MEPSDASALSDGQRELILSWKRFQRTNLQKGGVEDETLLKELVVRT